MIQFKYNILIYCRMIFIFRRLNYYNLTSLTPPFTFISPTLHPLLLHYTHFSYITPITSHLHPLLLHYIHYSYITSITPTLHPLHLTLHPLHLTYPLTPSLLPLLHLLLLHYITSYTILLSLSHPLLSPT